MKDQAFEFRRGRGDYDGVHINKERSHYVNKPLSPNLLVILFFGYMLSLCHVMHLSNRYHIQ